MKLSLSHSKRQGFTFIELVLAIFLFTMGMLSVLQIFPVNRRYLLQSTQQSQAAFLAQEQIEVVRGLSYDSLSTGAYEPRAFLPSGAGTFATQFERSTDVSLIDGTYAATGTDVGLKKVTVTVYWSERNITRTYVLTTYANNI